MKFLFIFLSFLSFSSAWSQNTAQPAPIKDKKENPYEVEMPLLKTKSSIFGQGQFICQQKDAKPKKEIRIIFDLMSAKKVPAQGLLFESTNFNKCQDYKLIKVTDKKINLIFKPGEKNDEPGSYFTLQFNWNKTLRKFEQVNKKFFSPYQIVQKQYRKELAKFALAKAEKVILTQRTKVEALLEVRPEESHTICEDFHKSYEKEARNLFRQKKHKESFDLLMLMRNKFDDPQNIFFDVKAKKKPIVLVCPLENSNTDQSEEQFTTFAKHYFNHLEFVPFMLKLARKKINEKTNGSTDTAIQILKHLSVLLKGAPHLYQMNFENELIEAWNLIIKDNPEHAEYDHLIDEDVHLVFLFAEKRNCAAIPKPILKRISQKNDNMEMIKAMTLVAGDDFYAEGLIKSAIYEYREFALGRALLNKCEQIPKVVLERYFKYSRHPDNDTSGEAAETNALTAEEE